MGNYSVVVTSANACGDGCYTDAGRSLLYRYLFSICFTPNNDRVNDSFGPIGKLIIYPIINYVFITVRRIVFYSENPLEKWDGWFKGKKRSRTIYLGLPGSLIQSTG